MIEYTCNIANNTLSMTIQNIADNSPNHWISKDMFFTFLRCTGSSDGKIGPGGLTLIIDSNFLPITIVSKKYSEIELNSLIEHIDTTISDMTQGINKFVPMEMPDIKLPIPL